jgi:hypothetical protein
MLSLSAAWLAALARAAGRQDQDLRQLAPLYNRTLPIQ